MERKLPPTFANLRYMVGGDFADQVDSGLGDAIEDVERNPLLDKPRKVMIEIAITPEVDRKSDPANPQHIRDMVKFQVKKSLPQRATPAVQIIRDRDPSTHKLGATFSSNIVDEKPVSPTLNQDEETGEIDGSRARNRFSGVSSSGVKPTETQARTGGA